MHREIKDGHIYINKKPFRLIDGKVLMTKRQLADEMLLSMSRINRLIRSGELTAYLENGQPKPVDSNMTVYLDYWQWKNMGKTEPVKRFTRFNRFTIQKKALTG